jgi:hypothetical protein
VDVALAEAGAVYLHIGLWAAGSAVLVLVTLQLLPVGRQLAGRTLGAVAIGLYYWYAATSIEGTLSLGDPGIWVSRAGAGTLIAVWLLRWAG